MKKTRPFSATVTLPGGSFNSSTVSMALAATRGVPSAATGLRLLGSGPHPAASKQQPRASPRDHQPVVLWHFPLLAWPIVMASRRCNRVVYPACKHAISPADQQILILPSLIGISLCRVCVTV